VNDEMGAGREEWALRVAVMDMPSGKSADHLLDLLAIRRLREECLPLAPSWPESVRGQVVAAIEEVIAALESDDADARVKAWSAESAAWSAAESAESAAWSAARSAGSAAESAAWSAAESAARSAGSAAWSAAWSAVGSAAWSAESAGSAARSAAFEREASRIVEELERIGAEVTG
jgi:hypothetical protein